MRVLVAMSGGVDSSVAAALLTERFGADRVVGATLKLWGGSSDSGCCSVADVDDARRVAGQLGLVHHVFNFADEFEARGHRDQRELVRGTVANLEIVRMHRRDRVRDVERNDQFAREQRGLALRRAAGQAVEAVERQAALALSVANAQRGVERDERDRKI